MGECEDGYLLRLAIQNAGERSAVRRYRWAHVMRLLEFGRTSAHEICERFGVDYDEVVGGCRKCYAEPCDGCGEQGEGCEC